MYGYLTGLVAFQYLIALACGWFVKNLLSAGDPAHINVRLSGALIAGVGLFLTLESFEEALLNAFT